MSDLPIPLIALEDCGAILGRRGSGKSATKQLLLEHELDAGRRCVLIDPKGDSWGIRLNPDGSPSRFDVPIFGGEHGDVPVSDTMGAVLGSMIATHTLSCVVDLSGFSTAGMRRFMRDFAEALFEGNRAPLTLFVDEADQLAPQTVPADMATLLHEMERLIRQGRQRGIFMWMLTQRPQVLNKNLLSQAETLIAMKMTTPHDRKAVSAWMEAHDPALAKEVMATLSDLKVGEAWAWVPGADFLERVQFPLFSTYDSGRTPKHGERVEGVVLPPIDMAAVSAALAEVQGEPVEAKRARGKHLAEEIDAIADLQIKLAAMTERALSAETLLSNLLMATGNFETSLGEMFEMWGLVDAYRCGVKEHLEKNDWIAPAKDDWSPEDDFSAIDDIRGLRAAVEKQFPRPQAKPRVEAGAAEKAAVERGSRRVAARTATATSETMDATARRDGNPAALAIADLLDRINPAKVTWTQAATMTGRKATGGNFNAARKWLRESGRIVEEGDLIWSAADAPEGMTGNEAIDLWKSVLINPAPRMIDALLTGPLTKEGLGEAIGAAPRGGNFNNGLAQLRRNGVAVERGGRFELARPLPGEAP